MLTLIGPPNLMTSFMLDCSQFPPIDVFGVMSCPLDSRLLYPTLYYTSSTWCGPPITNSEYTKPSCRSSKNICCSAPFFYLSYWCLLPSSCWGQYPSTLPCFLFLSRTTLNPSGNNDSSTFKKYLYSKPLLITSPAATLVQPPLLTWIMAVV